VHPSTKSGASRFPPLEKFAAAWIPAIRCARQLTTGRGIEILLAVSAIAIAALWRPPVRENPVDGVGAHDLAVHLVHEVEVVRTKGARDPQLGIGPVTAWLSVAV